MGIIYDTQRVDIHKHKARYESRFNKLQVDKQISKRNKILITEYLQDKLSGEVGQTADYGKLYQYVGQLPKFAKHFKKDLDKLQKDEVRQYLKEVKSGVIKSEKGQPYSISYSKTLHKSMNTFRGWLESEYSRLAKKYPDLFKGKLEPSCYQRINFAFAMDRGTLDDSSIIRLTEIRKIVDSISEPYYKALVYSLWDIGGNVQEILNIRLKNLKLVYAEDKKDYVYYITIGKSKNVRRSYRNVDNYFCVSALREWVEIHHPFKDDENAFLFPKKNRGQFYNEIASYQTVFNFVMDRISKILGNERKVRVHDFRHSSASEYVFILPYAQFCRRMGWSLNSAMADHYTKWAERTEAKPEVLNKIQKTQIDEVLEENKHIRTNLAIQQKEFLELKDQNDKQQIEIKNISAKLNEVLRLQVEKSNDTEYLKGLINIFDSTMIVQKFEGDKERHLDIQKQDNGLFKVEVLRDDTGEFTDETK